MMNKTYNNGYMPTSSFCDQHPLLWRSLGRLFRFLPLYFLAVLLFVSCSDDDNLTPSNADINGFAPAADDNSATARIRNDFFNATGTYLLFSDTLVSKSSNGEPELFDATWSITGSSSVSTDIDDYDYNYSYITSTDKQRQAANTIREHLVSKLGKQLPFSFLLVDDVYYKYTTWSGSVRTTHLPMLIAPRGYVISTQDGLLYQNPDSLVNTLIADMVITKIQKADASVTEPFLSFSSQYYGQDFEDIGLSLDDFEDDETYIWNYGMFSYGDWWGGYFYSQKRDIQDWVGIMLAQDRDTFAKTYGSSSVMMSKYDALKQVIRNMGFNI